MKNKEISFTKEITFARPVTIKSIYATCKFIAILNGKYLLNSGSVTVYLTIKYYDESNNECHSLSTNIYKTGTVADREEIVSGTLTIQNKDIKENITKISMETSYEISGANNYSSATFDLPTALLNCDQLTFDDDIKNAILNNELLKRVTVFVE